MNTNNPGVNTSNHPYILYIFVAFTLILSTSSCVTSKDTSYFKTLRKDTTISGFVTNDFESKIKTGDNLSIVATSLSKAEDELFNQALGEVSSFSGEGKAGFLVRPDGTVLLHRLGNVPAAGFTRKEFAAELQKALLPYMKDPIVNVNYLNHKVTVMGAVSKPQVLSFTEEQLSVLDVLVSSGDITNAGKKNDVMIIRESGTEKKIKHINLEDNSILTSPWYYIQPNDIVYVIPDYDKVRREEKRRSVQTTLSLVASGVSLIIIVLDRIIK